MKRLSSVNSRVHHGHAPPRHRLGAAFLAICFFTGPHRVLRPEIRPEEVAILDNGDSVDSLKVVEMYRRLRGIPPENVLRLRLGMNRRVKQEVYAERIARPLAEWLRGRERITTLVTTTGVPYVVEGLSGKPGSLAALDNEIAAVLSPAPVDSEQWAPNPLFAKSTDPARRRGPRSVGMLRVARLDGPSFEIVERLVVDAIAVEREGLAGRVFVDARGHKGTTGYAAGDALLREGYERLSGAGFPCFLDEREQSWMAGKDSRSAIAEGAAYYAGWYNLRSFQDIFGEKGLARGAIAWHLASSEAVDLWSEKERGWCVNLLRRGAAVTWGPVFEPYVHAFPHSDTLLDALLEGASIGEAYWLALPHVSWAMVLIGDPMYRPFAVARPSAVLETYRSGLPESVAVEPRKPGPLLVRIRAIGPPGSRLPPLAGRVRAGSGVLRARGDIEVPALAAGEARTLRVEEVEVGGGAGDPFRLILDLTDPAGARREAVLEGRSGLARLTAGGVHNQVLAADARGEWVLGGLPTAPVAVRIADLESLPLAIPPEEELLEAAFSPDSRRIALELRAPGATEGRLEIRSISGVKAAPIPPGSALIQWLSPSEALLGPRPSTGPRYRAISRFDVETGRSVPVASPDGWQGVPLGDAGAVLLRGPRGEVAFRLGDSPPVEVLQGKGPFLLHCAADDLSLFAGLDAQKSLWLQHGGGEEPVVVGEAPEGRVYFGRLGRRVAWSDAGRKGRIHDGASRKTFEAGPLLRGWWSGDERRFAFVSSEASRPKLRSWTEDGLRDLFPVEGLGTITLGAFTRNGLSLVLMAGADVELDLWALDLEPLK